jgi:hypothetical protein
MSFYDYSLYGYYSDKIINWSWLFFTGTVIVWFWKKKLMRIYFYSLISLILLSILPMAIPFFGILYSFSTIDDYQQIKLNNTYRIERTKNQALSMPRIYIYERKGLIEKNICRPRYAEIIDNVLNIERDQEAIDEKGLSIQNAKLISFNKDSIGIEYQISGKKKIIYHKLKNEDGY